MALSPQNPLPARRRRVFRPVTGACTLQQGSALSIAAPRCADTLLVSMAAFLWATVGIANGLVSGSAGTDAALCAATRTAVGGLSLLLIAEFFGIPRRGARFPWHAIAVFAIAGALFQNLLFAGFATAGVTVTVAVHVCGSVVLVAAGSALWNQTRPEGAASGAIAVATFGVALTMFGENGSIGALASLTGSEALVVLGSAVAFAVVCGAAGAMTRDLHPLRAAGLGLSATSSLLLFAFLHKAAASKLSLPCLLSILPFLLIRASSGLALPISLLLRASTSAGPPP